VPTRQPPLDPWPPKEPTASPEQGSPLADDDYTDAVHADAAEAHALGASGVPFFVIDRRFGVSGAQPAEAFLQALRTAYAAETEDPW
jgi:predicted DsbA family dithiol-disulfide isomerase